MATILDKICIWCNSPFQVKLSNKTKILCTKKCMYAWRKAQHWEIVNCVGCGTAFSRRKNEKHHRTGLPKQYCSNKCSLSSIQKQEKLKAWGNSSKNHWNKSEIQEKVKCTKKQRYGNENYNNMTQSVQTCMERYNRPYAVELPKSMGRRISKPQRLYFEQIKQQHPDAELEKWLPNVQKSVDIFIPSKNKIIEIFGTYWHCDPKKYVGEYYNKAIKKTASEIWLRDKLRKDFLESFGYIVETIWESDIDQAK